MTPLQLKDCLILDPTTTNPCFATLMDRYYDSLQSSLRYYGLNIQVRNDLALKAMEKFLELLQAAKYQDPRYLPLPLLKGILNKIRQNHMRKDDKAPKMIDFQDLSNSLESAIDENPLEEWEAVPLPIELRRVYDKFGKL